MKITTIKIEEETKIRLNKFKTYNKESYNSVIKKMLNILGICIKNPVLSARILKDIERNKKAQFIIDNPERVMRRKSLENKI